MSRTARWQRLQALPLLMDSLSTPARASLLTYRGISSTCAPRQSSTKNTEWIRGKLWKKGEAPGPADPYTQRPADEAAAADAAAQGSNLPAEALDGSGSVLRSRRDKTPAAVRDTRILLPARRSEATAERDVGASDPTYVPATEADGLEEIGALSTWWEQPGHWGEESEFRGFAGGKTKKGAETDKEVLEVHLRRALVEVLALQRAGRFGEWAARRWRAGGTAEMEAALGLEVRVEEGRAALSEDAAGVVEGLMMDGSEGEKEGAGAGAAHVTTEEARGMIKSWDSSWKNTVLDDTMKFALRKRLYQLTGNLVPDARLAAATTVRHVLTLAAKDAKPLKLAEALEKRNAFGSLANVTVHGKKIGAIDKEVAVGRWKVIEEELRKRDLPVTGYGKMRKNKERDWLTGKI